MKTTGVDWYKGVTRLTLSKNERRKVGDLGDFVQNDGETFFFRFRVSSRH